MYRTINDSLWSEPWLERLSKDARLLLVCLLTNPRLTPTGVVDIGYGALEYQTGLRDWEIEAALGELETSGKVKRLGTDSYQVEVTYSAYIPTGESMERRRWDRKARRLRPVILARDGNRCVTCGATEDLTIDHIIPIINGGRDDYGNLQTLCRTCNSRKGARS